MRMSQKTKGLMSIMIPVIAWGISFVSTEYVLRYLGPMTIGAIRFIIASLLLHLVIVRTPNRAKIDKKDRPLFVLSGGVGIALYFFFENLGIKYISAAPSALIIAAIPLVTLLFEWGIYKRPMKAPDILAVLLSVVGVTLVVDLNRSELFQSEETLGYLLMLGAVLTWVVYSMTSKPLFKRYSYLNIVYHQFVYSIPFFIVCVPFENNQWGAMTLEIGAHLLFLSIFASVLGFYYYAKAMDLLGVTEASIFINLLPIVTIVFGYVYLGSALGVRQLIGGALIMSAATLETLFERHTTRREKRRLARRKKAESLNKI